MLSEMYLGEENSVVCSTCEDLPLKNCILKKLHLLWMKVYFNTFDLMLNVAFK